MQQEQAVDSNRYGLVGEVAVFRGDNAILSVGAGDKKLTFDKTKPEERAHAATVVADMLKHGFSLLVQVDVKDGEPVFARAKAFVPETCEYIVITNDTNDEEIDIGKNDVRILKGNKLKTKKGVTKRIPADQTRTVSVGRTSGG